MKIVIEPEWRFLLMQIRKRIENHITVNVKYKNTIDLNHRQVAQGFKLEL